MIRRYQILFGFLFSVFLNCGFSQITDTSNYKYYRQSIATDMLMLEDDPADSKRWMRVANHQQKIQDFSGAIVSHDMAIRYSPTDYRAVNSRGVIKHKIGDFKGAIDDYTLAMSMNAEFVDPIVGRYLVYLKIGIIDSAKHDLELALSVNRLATLSTIIGEAQDAYESGNFEFALLNLDFAIENDTSFRIEKNYLERGFCKNEMGDYESAILDFNEVLKINPNNAKAWNNRGFAKYMLGHLDDALLDMNHAVELDPTYPQAYNKRGDLKCAMREFESALNDLNIAVKLDPTNFTAFHNRAIAKAGLNDHRGAIFDFTIAIQMNPDNALSYQYRAISYQALGEFEKADQDLRMVQLLQQQ